jgi:hypothetical protein
MQRTGLYRLALVAAAGLLVISHVSAQTEPIRNWAAPLYWQPSRQESALILQAREAHRTVQEVAGEPRQAVEELSPVVDALVSYPPLVFVGMTPCRVMDTRVGQGQTGAFGPPALGVGETRTVPLPAHPTCGVPATAQAYSLNVTVVPPGPLGYITMWPTGATKPLVATLNALDGQIHNNAAIVPAGVSGSINIYVTNATDVVVDMNGYYAPPNALALGPGAAGTPALTFGDTLTGLYSTGLGSVSIATGGTERVQVTPAGLSVAGNLDFSNAITKAGANFLRTNADSLFVGEGADGSMLNIHDNSAFGGGALASLTTNGSWNTAVGYQAGTALTSGQDSVAVGERALYSTTDGSENTAVGDEALYQNVHGAYNTALGSYALNSASGSSNIAIGYYAGNSLSTGSNNIDIGNVGVGTESGTTRIGSGSQTRTFISGIRGVTTGNSDAVAVMIDSNGQLGTVSSSRTVKRDIEDMGDTTGTIMGLRPVRFRYKAHGPDSPRQYGLVAEEVAEVAPDLVARNNDGEIETVYYDKVYAMMLNELQAQRRVIESQKKDLIQLESRLAELESRVK